MPKPPSTLDKINGIIDFAHNPCDAPWWVYAEAAKAPAGQLALELVTFGMADLVRGYFRPKNLRRGGHLRRRRRGRRGRGGIPDTAELVAKSLWGQQAVSKRQVSQGVKAMWIVDGVMQRALWYWFLADVGLDFFYNWMTAVQETEFCEDKTVASGLAEGLAFGALQVVGWQGVGPDQVIYKRGNLSFGGGSVQAGDDGGHIYAGGEVLNPLPIPIECQAGIWIDNVFGEPVHTSDILHLGPFQRGGMVVTGSVPPNSSAVLCSRAMGGGSRSLGGFWSYKGS